MTDRARATLVGFGAVLLWAALALLATLSGTVPPFQLAAICFAIGAGLGWLDAMMKGRSLLTAARQPLVVWLVGVGGLFGYHFFYFTAIRNAPGAETEASLIAYLWPLLIVLFSALLPGERLRPVHVIAGLIGFAGAALIVTKGEALSFDPAYSKGFAAAAVCAVTWSGYSVLSRRLGAVPTETVTWFCLASAILSALCHLAMEQTAWPSGAVAWMATIGLGLGPVGGAFYLWDYGVKRGNIQLLGVASFAAPLFSTVLMVLVGYAQARWSLWAGAALIAGSGLLAAMAPDQPASDENGPA